jgi:hypothetical protein
MKLLKELEERRIEEAFASKTYGPDNPPPPEHEGPFRQRVRNMMAQLVGLSDMVAMPGGPDTHRSIVDTFIPEADDHIKDAVLEFIEDWWGWHKQEGEIGYAKGHPGHAAVNNFIEDIVHMKEGGLR